jgi:hypothetical protein
MASGKVAGKGIEISSGSMQVTITRPMNTSSSEIILIVVELQI